jgi:hypothetical protein
MIAEESTNLARYRVEIRTSIIFDVIMPEDATEQEVTAQASADYRAVIDSRDGNTVDIGLPDCRLYMDTKDNWNPAEISIQDLEPFYEDENEDAERHT